MPPAMDASSSGEAQRPSATEYNTFVGQIELRAIWLQRAKIVNAAGPVTPEHAAIRVEARAEWEPWGAGFQALHQFTIRVETPDTVLAEIEVTFGLHFASGQPMTEPLFAIFQDVNLPVNTWPYVREFVSTTMGRMNWVPFTLPALKRGAPPVLSNQAPSASPARRRRRHKPEPEESPDQKP
jgi:hypothetical protein